jgi:D-alanyl-lipoteichoic acid acyltransferase DltB (MBOAT superfamily)
MYSLQLYFDFSGYTEMAVGIGYMLNIKLPFNFKSPYTAQSFGEFWRRWHITLSNFLRDYVYFPLGGSRVSSLRALTNVMIVFLLSGLWHGVGLTFIAWGALHGLMVCFERVFKNSLEKVAGWVKWLFTLLMLNFFWVYFRAPDFQVAHTILAKMLGIKGQTQADAFFENTSSGPDGYLWLWENSRLFTLTETLSAWAVTTQNLIWFPLVGVIFWISWLAFSDTPEITKRFTCGVCNTLGIILMLSLCFCVLYFLPQANSEATKFLYARF